MADGGGAQTEEAEIRQALATAPDHPGLLAALGGLRLQAKATDEALALLQRAVGLAPDDARILGDYGAALSEVGRLDEAEAVLHAGLLVAPDDNLRFNLARCLQLREQPSAALEILSRVEQRGGDVCKLEGDLRQRIGDVDGALGAYVEALRISPDNAAYLNDLGVLIDSAGRSPACADLWRQLAAVPGAHPVVHYFLGNALRLSGDFAAARLAYERAIELEPTLAEAHNNLALVLGKLGLESEARAALERAATVNPDLAAARSNLGALMSRGSAIDEAAIMLREAVRLDPQSADARTNYGAVLMRQHRFAEARDEFRRVLATAPGFASAELNLGLALLTEGRLDEGWPYYEARWKQPQLLEKRPQLASPVWTGEVLDGRMLLVFAEQGFGDNLQFVRYLGVLRRRYPTARLIYYGLHALIDLFRASPLAADCEVVRWGDPIPAHDWHCPLMSLPWRCGTVLANIPDPGRYLAPTADLCERWRVRLPAQPGLCVGLVWASSETFVYRSAKTIALRALLPLFALPGIAWVNLQLGNEAAEIDDNGLRGCFLDPMPEVKDFHDTAAIVAGLDLVISVDTAVAHLAAAMGRPVWLLDRFDTDWRWLLDREDSPWYASLRIFRQAAPGDWGPVVERVKMALAVRASGNEDTRQQWETKA